uniref:Uncharacterized protein n=1 Tax=Sphaerodactylus townsendi TaxID=933632 RepID=A0ACB8EUN6_9SAUR
MSAEGAAGGDAASPPPGPTAAAAPPSPPGGEQPEASGAVEEAGPGPGPEGRRCRALVLTGFGGYEKVKVQARAQPSAAAGQVSVQVRACGLNFADLLARQGLYDRLPAPPFCPGMEAAGTVLAVGEGVDSPKVPFCGEGDCASLLASEILFRSAWEHVGEEDGRAGELEVISADVTKGFRELSQPDLLAILLRILEMNAASRVRFHKAATGPLSPGGHMCKVFVASMRRGRFTQKIGDRVMVMATSGLWQEVVTVPAHRTFPMPEGMSFEEAAAFLVNYITAYMVLFDFGNLRPNQSVLVHMAAGGVGTAAVQLCKTVENVTIFGTASASKHDGLRENGVTHPIDYRTTDYVEEVRKISPKGQ